MKTPKEEAQELFDKYNNYLQQEMNCIVYVENAKQCAIICVDEMYDIASQNDNVIQMNYLTDVKKELESL